MNSIDQVIANGPFQASWESLTQYRVPDWYQDGKLGIFIHWGLYSVPKAGTEWYARLYKGVGLIDRTDSAVEHRNILKALQENDKEAAVALLSHHILRVEDRIGSFLED